MKYYQCRLCLGKSEYSYSLLKLSDMIESLTSIKIRADDKFPTTCCETCLTHVHIAYRLQQNILKSDKILRKRLNTHISIKCTEEVEVFDVESNSDVKDESPELELLEYCEIKNESDSCSGIDFDQNCDENNKTSYDDTNIETKRETVEELPDSVDGFDVVTIDDSNLEQESSLAKFSEIINKRSKRKCNNQILECTECKIKFENKSALSLHLKKHDVQTCSICHISVRTDNFKKHFKLHSAGKEVCEICGSVAKNKESLRGHMFYQHRSNVEKFKCKECNREFRHRYKYTMHVKKVHTGERNYQCEVCGKKFFTAFDTKKHVEMTHYKARPYICKYCNRGYSSRYALKTHIRQHTLETPFRCELCAAGFRQRVSLRTHLKSKHKITDPNVLYGKVSLTAGTKCDTSTSFKESQITVDVEIIEDTKDKQKQNLTQDRIYSKNDQDTINKDCFMILKNDHRYAEDLKDNDSKENIRNFENELETA